MQNVKVSALRWVPPFAQGLVRDLRVRWALEDMTTVLRALRTTDLLSCRPKLDAYRARGEARPAFQKALADQMAAFAANAPKVP